MFIIDVVKLVRPQQWYKNLLVFLPLFFSAELFDMPALLVSFAGFVSLCLVSSANYVINDVVDVRQDRAHPEKASRPIASGKVSVSFAWFLAGILLVAALGGAWWLGRSFFNMVLLLFALTQAYTVFLKHEPFVDVLLISVNFVVRASSGAFLIGVGLSPWLFIGVFFFALFLAVCKRFSDVKLLGERAILHKPALRYYSEDLMRALMVISTVLVLVAYSLYTLASPFPKLLFTLPMVLYLIFRYFLLAFQGSVIARHPHLVFKDGRMVVGIVLWLVVAVLVIYS